MTNREINVHAESVQDFSDLSNIVFFRNILNETENELEIQMLKKFLFYQKKKKKIPMHSSKKFI